MSPLAPDNLLIKAGLLTPESKVAAGMASAPPNIQQPAQDNGGWVPLPPNMLQKVQAGRFMVGGTTARMAMFPDEFPESKDDKPGVVMRGIRGIAAGIADMAPATMALAAGVIDFLGADEAGQALGQKALDVSSWLNDHLAVENPTLYDHVMRGVGSMLTFILPGIGAASAAGKIATAAKMTGKVAQTFRAMTGGGAMSFLEAAVEQSQREMELIGQGMTPEEAMKESAPVFWHNMGVLMATNTVSYFLPLPIKVKNEFLRRAAKAVESAFFEGGQERAQAVIQDVAAGRGEWGDFLAPKKYGTETAVGTIVGGGTAFVLPGERDAPQAPPGSSQPNAPAPVSTPSPQPAPAPQAPAQAPQQAQPTPPPAAPAAPRAQPPAPPPNLPPPPEDYEIWTGEDDFSDVDGDEEGAVSPSAPEPAPSAPPRRPPAGYTADNFPDFPPYPGEAPAATEPALQPPPAEREKPRELKPQRATVFHAGAETLPNEVNLGRFGGLHAGTQQAAVDRITRPAERGRAHGLHELEIEYSNPYLPGGQMIDERTPDGRTLLFTLVNSGETRALAEQGYDVIPYINGIEDPGSISYVILDKRAIKGSKTTSGETSHAGEWKPKAEREKPPLERSRDSASELIPVVSNFENAGDRVTAKVRRLGSGKYSVSVQDMDSRKLLEEQRVFPALELAEGYARKVTAPKPAKPAAKPAPKPAPAPEPTVVNPEYADPAAAEEVSRLEARQKEMRERLRQVNAGETVPGWTKPEIESKIKSIGMQLAAARRRLTGDLTAKERKKIDERRASDHIGKAVSVARPDGTRANGKVTGNPFGRVTVELESGEKVTVDRDAIGEPVEAPQAAPAQTDPAKMDESDFISTREYRQQQAAIYVRGEDEVIASSRTTPQTAKQPPVGTWRIDDHRGIYGREIEQLREIPIEDLVPTELDEKGLVEPAKRADAERYAEWLAAGNEAPPITVLEREDGTLAVTDGHRRFLAAKAAGHKTIRAWVSPAVETGKIDANGKPIMTGLTYEIAKGIAPTEAAAQAAPAPAQTEQKAAPRGPERFGAYNDLKDLYVNEVGAAQRHGPPEALMLKAVTANGGGVMNPALEHIGDISHRITDENTFDLDAGWDAAGEKVDRAIKWLTHRYGFLKEHGQNLIANAKALDIPLQEHEAKVSRALEEYARAHAAIPVFNRAQWHARQAAVELGRLNIEKATEHLKALKEMMDEGATPEEQIANWMKYAHEFDPGLARQSGMSEADIARFAASRTKAAPAPAPAPAAPEESRNGITSPRGRPNGGSPEGRYSYRLWFYYNLQRGFGVKAGVDPMDLLDPKQREEVEQILDQAYATEGKPDVQLERKAQDRWITYTQNNAIAKRPYLLSGPDAKADVAAPAPKPAQASPAQESAPAPAAEAKKPLWQMTRDEYDREIENSDRANEDDIGAKVIEDVGSSDPADIIDYYRKKYGIELEIPVEVNGSLAGGNTLARLITSYNKKSGEIVGYRMELSPEWSNKEARTAAVVRHEIEHVLDYHFKRAHPSKAAPDERSIFVKPGETLTGAMRRARAGHHANYQDFESDYLHRSAVARAVRAGLPVPAEVLADYPDLAARPAAEAAPAAEVPEGASAAAKATAARYPGDRWAVHQVPISEITERPEDMQNRDKGKASQNTIDSIKNKYDEAQMQPISLWLDPDTGNLVTVQGHSRTEGFRQSGRDRIPAFIFKNMTFAEAQKAAFEGNFMQDQGTDLDQIGALRGRIKNEGVTESGKIDEMARKMFRRNAPTIIALMHLNPNGRVMDALRSLSGAADVGDTGSNIKKMAKWIGEARRRNPNLTDAHEGEMFDTLREHFGKHKWSSTEEDFLKHVRGLAQAEGFNPENPLALTLDKRTAAEKEYDAEIEAAEKAVWDAQTALYEKENELAGNKPVADKNGNPVLLQSGPNKGRKKYAKPPNAKPVAEEIQKGILAKLKDAIKIAEDDLKDVIGRKARFVETRNDQGGLFRIGGRGKWAAVLTAYGDWRILGYFDTKADAVFAVEKELGKSMASKKTSGGYELDGRHLVARTEDLAGMGYETEDSSKPEGQYRVSRPNLTSLNKSAEAFGLSPAVTQQPRDLMDEIVVRVAKMFGFRNVQFVSGLTTKDGRMAHGYYQSQTDSLFLNVGSPEPMLTVLMHEVAHRMEIMHPDLYGQLAVILNDPAFVRAGAKEVYLKNAEARGYSSFGSQREWIGDGLMEASSRPEFWEVLRQKNPTLAGKLIGMITDAIKAIRKMFVASGASVDVYYTNFGPLVRQLANVAAQMQAREAEVARANRPATNQTSMFRVNKTLRKIATWFSGTGTLEAVLARARGVHAVEYSPEIIDQYNKVYGTKYTARDVTEIDPLEVAQTGADHFHASPVCKNFSKAKRNRGSNDLDIASARAVVNVILKANMPSITIENVVDYIDTEPYKMITEALKKAGYKQRTVRVNAADYGGAQNRTRMIIQAVKDGELPVLPEVTGPSDWFELIKDLLPTAEKSTVAEERVKGRGWNWEPDRIARMVERGELDPTLPIITMGGSTDKVRAWAANAGGAAPTLKATGGEVVRIIMPDGTVYRATPRMMARLMGMPDSFKIPDDYKFAKKVLGNGIHGNITKAFIEPLVNGERGTTSSETVDQLEMFRVAPLSNQQANEFRDRQDAAMKANNQPRHSGWRAGWRHVYMLMVDKHTFLYAAVRDAVKAANANALKGFSLVKNPYIAIRRFNSWMSAVDVALHHVVKSWDNKTVLSLGLQQIIKKHGLADAIDDRSFGLFYTAAAFVSRKYSLASRGFDFFGDDPTTPEYQAAEAEFLKWQQIYDDYKKAHPEWVDAVDDFTKYAYALIQRSYEAGVIPEEQFNYLTRTYSVYAPLFVIDSSQYHVDRGDPVGAGSIAHEMKRFDPTAVRMDPIDALIKHTYHTEFFTRRNEVARQHADFIRRFRDKSMKGVTHLEGFGRRIKPKTDPVAKRVQDILEAAGLTEAEINSLGRTKAQLESEAKIYVTSRVQPDGVIALLRNGEIEYWQLDPDIYESFMAATGPKVMHPLMKFFSAQTSLLRAGAVLTPDFMARNQFRDFASSGIISQHLIRNPLDPFLLPVRILRGLSHAIKRDEIYLEFMLEAGYSQLAAQDQVGLRKSSEALSRSSRTRAGRAGQFAKNPAKYVLHSHPITILQEFGKLTENSTRIAIYEKTKADLLKMGWSEAEATVKAAMEARESSIDFARSGKYGQVINQIIPFFNAAVQGNDKAFRTFVSDSQGRGAAWLKATTLITIPSILLWALNHDDDWYKEQPIWLKNNFWLFSVDGGKTIHKIPKPFEVGLMYASLAERFLDWNVDKDPKAMKEWSEAVLKNIVAVNDKNPVASVGGLLGPMAGTMTEIVSNYDSFRGTPIVKGWLEEVAPREQFNANTSEFAKAMGGMAPGSGISPMMIDHFIRGSFGGLGVYASKFASQIIMLAKPELRAMKPSDKQIHTLVGFDVPDWLPVIKAFAQASPSGYTRQMNDFFEIYDRSREASKTLQAFKASGAPRDKFMSLYRRSGADIAMAKPAQEVAEKLGQLSKRARFIESMPSSQMSRDEKREQINQLVEERNLWVKKFLERYYQIDQRELQRQIEAAIPQLERDFGR